MKDTMTIHPESAVTIMYGILGRLKDAGGMYGDLRAIDIQLHASDMGAFNHVHVDYDMPDGSDWEDQVDVNTIRLVLNPPLGGEPIVLSDVRGSYPRSRIDGPVTFVVTEN